MKKMAVMVFGFVICTMAAGLLVGCDEADVNGRLEVLPEAATIDANGGSVVFTAYWIEEEDFDGTNLTARLRSTPPEDKELALPIEWSVSDSNLGSITAGSGNSAAYVSSGRVGVNTVIARDQYGAEGLASVTQE